MKITDYFDNGGSIKDEYEKKNIDIEGEKNKSNLIIRILKGFGKISEYEIFICFFSEKTDIEDSDKQALLLRNIYLKKLVSTFRIYSGEYIIMYEAVNNQSNVDNINKALLEKDFYVSPMLQLEVYYLNRKNMIILYPYDDRGINIYELNQSI